MFRANSKLAGVTAALAAATVIAGCGSSSPSSSSSSGPASQAQIQQSQQDVVRFAQCMRLHGVPDFPDPSTSPHAFKEAFNTQSPAFLAAVPVCQHLLPDGGRRNQPARRTPAQAAAMLAFARCLRGHGFPNFPDPTSTGDLSHEMIASAGINLHQPAVVQAADACVTVTHGLITRAAVARFLAGQ
ncbi:MAG TPA: hypothetical protein VGH56_06505 [Solirubrobacteraceae bacterium]